MTVLDLQQYLVQRHVCDVQVLNIGEGRAVINGQCIGAKGPWDFLKTVMCFASQGYLIHLETNGHNFKSWLSALICVMAGYANGHKTIIAFGSGNLPAYLHQLTGWRKLIAKTVLSLAGVIICRNKDMVDAIQSVSQRSERIEIVPGFMGLQTRKSTNLPNDAMEFFAARKPLLGATVGVGPEYGASLALQAVQRLLNKYPSLGLVLLGIGPESAEQFSELAALREHVLLVGKVDANVALTMMQHFDIFLRPTYFDGDSLSVREALASGIPVVASNTGLRPKGVVLFETGQVDDLEEKIDYAVQRREQLISNQLNTSESSGGIDLMMQIYQRLAPNQC